MTGYQGNSISGTRTACSDDDVRRAAFLPGGPSQRHLQAAITLLLADGRHPAAREPRPAA